MASVQDIESRLGVVERKLDFLMRQIKVQKITPTGLLDEHGRPQARVEAVTLLDAYREVATGIAAPLTPVVENEDAAV